ncbi:MAG: hypothetical protein IJW16_06985, partial [Clostridia bacterium]|nr:hypothetical protein [Clostridia bacterium]
LDQINEEASVNNSTLSMWVVSEKKISAETAALVTAEINAVTEEKLKTRLAINFYTMDEYQSKLSAAIKAFDPASVVPSTDTSASGNTNADGSFYEPTYPALLANQVDIVYIEGKEMYTTYVANDWLAPIESDIATASTNKPLQEYISTVVLNAAKFNGKNIYALPNNNLVGDYTYMMLNRELMDEIYGGYANNISGFYDRLVYNYLETVFERKNASGAEDNYVLIDAEYDQCLDLLAHYWSLDENSYALLEDFSVFGHLYTDKASLNRGSVEFGYNNLFANDAFADAFLKLNSFEANGFFGDAEASNKPAALKLVTCDLASLDEYTDEYYPVIVSYPTLTDDDLFNNGMFGVCKKSVNVSRSVEIITYINTNEKVRNALYYGVKGVHYDTMEREENGEQFTVAYKLNNDYQMSMAKTGNLFLVYPTVDLENEENSMNPNAWAIIKQQNFEAKIDPLLGFAMDKTALNTDLADYLGAINADLLKIMDDIKAGDDWYDELVALTEEIAILLDANSNATVEDFTVLRAYLESDAFAELVTEEVEGETVGVNDLETLRENLKLAMSKDAVKVGGKNYYSPYGVYKKWVDGNGFSVK